MKIHELNEIQERYLIFCWHYTKWWHSGNVNVCNDVIDDKPVPEDYKIEKDLRLDAAPKMLLYCEKAYI